MAYDSALCRALWMFPHLCGTAENMSSTHMAIVWNPVADRFNCVLFHNPSINDHAQAYFYLVNQIKYIKESVQVHILDEYTKADIDIIMLALTYCLSYAAVIDKEDAFYDIFVWGFLMPLKTDNYKKLFNLLRQNPIYFALCLQAARVFQKPVSSIKPLPHEVVELMQQAGISQVDAVLRLQHTACDVRLQFLGFLREIRTE